MLIHPVPLTLVCIAFLISAPALAQACEGEPVFSYEQDDEAPGEVLFDGVVYSLIDHDGDRRLFAISVEDGLRDPVIHRSLEIAGEVRGVYGISIDFRDIDILFLEADVGICEGDISGLRNLVVRGSDTSAWFVERFVETHEGMEGCSLIIQEMDDGGSWANRSIITDFSQSYRTGDPSDGVLDRPTLIIAVVMAVVGAALVSLIVAHKPEFR